jgi:thiol-disulfide isomerase/thioredoxin
MMRAPLLFAALALVGCGDAATPVRVGDAAPDARVVDLASGDTVSLRTRYAGQVTLVNIWATWCGPCKEEIPALDSLYRALGPSGLRIATVSIDTDDGPAVLDWLRPFDVAFDVLHDQSGAIQQIYRTTGVPESFLLDKEGRIMRIVHGAHPWNSVANRRIVSTLLNAPEGS